MPRTPEEEAARQREYRARETPEQHAERLAKWREAARQRLAEETPEMRERRLARVRKRATAKRRAAGVKPGRKHGLARRATGPAMASADARWWWEELVEEPRRAAIAAEAAGLGIREEDAREWERNR